VKELKVLDYLHHHSVTSVTVESGEGIERKQHYQHYQHQPPWNPVKELKVQLGELLLIQLDGGIR